MEFTKEAYEKLERKYGKAKKEIENMNHIYSELAEEYDELVSDYSRRGKELHELKMEQMKWEHYLDTHIRKGSTILQ